ncbi:MAG: type III pantothenate kinase [Ruminococcaceae bacterium]|nr:type III pantothenate kinase [Oscillospiraceae bacterium]
MILAIDVGNTNVVLGAMEGTAVQKTTRLVTDSGKGIDGYARELAETVGQWGDFTGAVISSVVPDVTKQVTEAVRQVLGLTCLEIHGELELGFRLPPAQTAEVAADLITAAAAAVDCCKLPLILIDMGTATTVMTVDRTGMFLGGAIAPGPKMMMSSLAGGTALLPAVPLDVPKHNIGRDTVECLQCGTVLGAAAMVEGLVDRMEQELGEPAEVIATGGLAGSVLPLCRRAIRLEPDLMLRGLAILYEKNK